jgi:hypothetical protein
VVPACQEDLAKLEQVRNGCGPKPPITREKMEQIGHDTLHAKPKGERIGAQGRWPPRRVSRSTVQPIWHARRLKHRMEVQALHLPGVRRRAHRRGRAVTEPAGAITLYMDEVPSAGAGVLPAVAVDAEGPGRYLDPRLPSARRHHDIRRAQRTHLAVIKQKNGGSALGLTRRVVLGRKD